VRICYLCADHGIPVLGRKGCSTHVRETCRALREAGHEIFIVTPQRGPDLAEYHDLDIIEVPPFQSRFLGSDLRQWLYNFRLGRRLNVLFRERRPDTLYERYSLYSTAGMRIARRYGLPRIVEVNALLVQEQRERIHFPFFASRIEDRVVRSAPSIIVVSSPLREAFIRRGVAAERIHIMPMAVDVRRFHPEVEPADLRARFGLDGKTIVGYVGSIAGWHGLDLLFESAERIKALGEALCFVIIGGDEKKVDRYVEQVRSRGLDDYLLFLGSVPYTQVPHYVSAMDITVIPASMEWASPTKLFEYQAMGKPAVAPRLVPVVDVLADGREGYLFPPGDAQSLTDCLLRLHRDPSQRRAMGLRARQKVVERFAWEKNTRRIIEMFEKMLAERKGTVD
jgi:glycosyltransferase involved in cell wall biosynthesis